MYAEQLEEIPRLLSSAFRQFTPIEDLPDLSDDVRSIVSGNDRLTPLQQAEIYRGQFWLRHACCFQLLASANRQHLVASSPQENHTHSRSLAPIRGSFAGSPFL